MIAAKRGINENPIRVGDMNAKIECVAGTASIQPKSRNGRIMMETLIETCKLEVINFSEKCSGKCTCYSYHRSQLSFGLCNGDR